MNPPEPPSSRGFFALPENPRGLPAYIKGDMMNRLIMDGNCRDCGKAIHETSPWNWTHTRGRYHCNDSDITDRRYATPDRETIAKATERTRHGNN